MQAADFAAYELKKYHEDNNKWFGEIAPTIDRKNMYESLFKYQLERDGILRDLQVGNRRGSLNALS